MTDHTPLTPQGEARRDAMLADLLARQSRHHHVRRLQRAAAVAALALIFITLCTVPVLLRPPQPNPAPILVAQQPQPAPAPAINYIATDPTLASRWSVATPVDPAIMIHTEPLAIEYLTDDSLLARLEEIGRPTGLIRSQGRTILTASITEEEPAPGPESGPAPTPPS